MKIHPRYSTDSFELIGGPYPVLPQHPAGDIWLTEVPREDLNKAVTRFLHSCQSNREQALSELIELSRKGADTLAGIKSALTLILDSGVHGRISDATQFLTCTGQRLVTKLASQAEPASGKLGYVIVRALGHLGERELVLQFKDLDESVREGVAEALDEIGDALSLKVLQNLRDNDKSDFIRRLAGELLDEH
jgi:hypothetical protein